MNEKILIIEDAPRVVQLVRVVLGAVGYEVIAAVSGEAGLELVAAEQPDLILLDILLPGAMDGYAVCRRIREFSDVPLIMLTAKAQTDDLLRGFDAGADDYVTKPFNSKELVARVRAVLNRTQHNQPRTAAILVCGEIEIDLARHIVRRCGQDILLTRTEYALLCQLAIHLNCVVTLEDLLTAVWGAEYRNDLDYVRAYIRYLRRKLEKDPSHPQYILTAPGVGYMLSCPTQVEVS